jgi:uncharacterized membrane protein
MAKHKTGLGSWAFLIGVVLAIIFGLIGMTPTIAIVLMVVGLIAGLLNVTDDESTPFLLSGAVLIIASSLGQTGLSAVPQLQEVLSALLSIFVPATIVVAVRNVFAIAKR